MADSVISSLTSFLVMSYIERILDFLPTQILCRREKRTERTLSLLVNVSFTWNVSESSRFFCACVFFGSLYVACLSEFLSVSWNFAVCCFLISCGVLVRWVVNYLSEVKVSSFVHFYRVASLIEGEISLILLQFLLLLQHLVYLFVSFLFFFLFLYHQHFLFMKFLPKSLFSFLLPPLSYSSDRLGNITFAYSFFSLNRWLVRAILSQRRTIETWCDSRSVLRIFEFLLTFASFSSLQGYFLNLF